ncbi:MAG TPA: polysaccharide biosynthesis protein [Chthonomonadales bacterium]|nr:polysaccharide biosynthesis protein [Chthonomonadales bacterium]
MATDFPKRSHIPDGRASVSPLRSVEIEDLLRREPISTDAGAVAELLWERTVLVTGGGGSIGSELCRQALKCRPRQLVVMGRGENSVFEIFSELEARVGQKETGRNSRTRITPVIADVRFPERMTQVMERYRPDILFHAAAHKHVPLMERDPGEAVLNNVLGTRNVVEAAISANVQRLILISTDKAVNPVSVMGASKRAAELLVLAAAGANGKRYSVVRFGNVLGSRGSVLRIFEKQIAAGGPVTVSHPGMQRYFITIPEAVQLVLQAAVLGKGGEVFVLDMGDPVRIVDLARDLIELYGLKVGKDIEITYTGIRPGEKLREEIFLRDEIHFPTEHRKILIARGETARPGINLTGAFEAAARSGTRGEVIDALRDLVPEYCPDGRCDTRNEQAVVELESLVGNSPAAGIV